MASKYLPLQRLSTSKKLARVVFNDPTTGETIIQEQPGLPPSLQLRTSISKAQDAFWAEYNDPKWKENISRPSAAKGAK